MRLVAPHDLQQNRQFAEWAAKRLEVTFSEPFAAYCIIDAQQQIAGAVVFNNYCGNNIDLAGVGHGAFTPSVIRDIARYVFTQLKCTRVTLKTRRSNKHVRRLLNKHFKFEAIIRLWFGNEDAFQFRLCRDECRWLEKY